MLRLEDIKDFNEIMVDTIDNRLKYYKDRMKSTVDHWKHFECKGWHEKFWIRYSMEYAQLQAEWMYWNDVKKKTKNKFIEI